MNLRYGLVYLVCFYSLISYSQNIYLTPLKKIKVSEKKIHSISFSSDAARVAVADEKGLVSLRYISNDSVLATIAGTTPALFHDFIDQGKTFLLLDQSGRLTRFDTERKESSFSELSKGIKLASLDPSQNYLSLLNKENNIEIIDLKAGMTSGRIQKLNGMESTLYLGFDRFGQQFAAINKTGDAITWNPLNQQLLRQLKLQSGDYSGSKSVIHSASANSSGDLFLIGLQEVFIPKGGMQGRTQPERRNILIAYDWNSGQEVKRVPLRYRADGIALGPGPMNVAYYSSDTRTIDLLNLDKAIVSSSVAVDERPSSIALSDDNTILAVGTVAGNVYLYEVVLNNPSEVKIVRPSINRNIGDQVVSDTSLKVEGVIDGTDKITKVVVNGAPATIDMSGSFSSEVKLDKGKNRIKVAVQNTQGIVTEKDFYITCEPSIKAKDDKQSLTHGKRVALVIGNSTYSSAAKLNNTVNDANSMAETLQSLGFEVIRLTNASYEQMKNAIYSFGDRIQEADVCLFYYAGHGLEVEGTNYLVPVDADITSALDVKLKAIPMTGVLRTMEFTNDEGLNMIILDACRNNPFPTGKRSSGSGLARVQAPSGTLIAYATDPGSVASDGDKTNGLYTGELIRQLKISQRIEDVFMNTRNSVEHLSDGRQRPWEEARLKGVFYLK